MSTEVLLEKEAPPWPCAATTGNSKGWGVCDDAATNGSAKLALGLILITSILGIYR